MNLEIEKTMKSSNDLKKRLNNSSKTNDQDQNTKQKDSQENQNVNTPNNELENEKTQCNNKNIDLKQFDDNQREIMNCMTPNTNMNKLIDVPSIFKNKIYSTKHSSTNICFINILSEKNIFKLSFIIKIFLFYKNDRWFRYIIIFSTLLEVAAYLMIDYSYRIHHTLKNSIYSNIIAKDIELGTNLVFTIEIVLIFIVFGINKHYRKYMFTSLNFLLLTILICSWISYSDAEVEVIEVWKYFRILTVFRLFPNLQKKVNAFFGSFRHLGKTFFPLICVIIFYSVIGISFFRGHIESRCRLTEYPDKETKEWPIDKSVPLTCGSKSCPANTFCGNNADYGLPQNHEDFDNETLLWGYSNFDDIFNALFSVYNFLMIDGWISTTNIYWRAQDKTISAIYFVSLVLFLSQIFSNIVLATLYEGFMNNNSIKSKKEDKDNQNNNKSDDNNSVENQTSIFRNQNKHHSKFMDRLNKTNKLHEKEGIKNKGVFQMILLSQISNIQNEDTLNKQNIFSFKTLLVKKSNLFSILIFINIVGIIIVLCLDSINIDSEQYYKLNQADFILTMFFFVLSFIEFISMGFKKYFMNNLLLIDIIIIILHIISYSCEGAYGEDIFNPINQYYIFVRWTKMIRSLRLFHDYTIFGSLRILMRTYYQTLKSLPEFFILWIVLIVLFAQIGRELLSGKDNTESHAAEEEVEVEELIRINYDNLQNSLIAVIMICFNEEWHLVMYKYRRVVGYKSILFHLFAMLILQVLFVRLFIGIFINVFMKWLRENEILLYNTQTTIILKKAWKQITDKFYKRKQKIQVKPTLSDKNNKSSQQDLNLQQEKVQTLSEIKNDKTYIINQTKQNGVSETQEKQEHDIFSQQQYQSNLDKQNNNAENKSQTVFMKRLNEYNKNQQRQQQEKISKASKNSQSQSIKEENGSNKRINFQTLNISNQKKHSRKISAGCLPTNIVHSLNNIVRSKSNDNITLEQTPKISYEKDQQFDYMKGQITGRTQSQASSANNHIIYNNQASVEKSTQMEEEIQEFIKFNGQNKNNTHNNQFSIQTPDKHVNFIAGLINQQNIKKEDTQNQTENHFKPQHQHIPSISIQSPINGNSYLIPILQMGSNMSQQQNINIINSQQYYKEEKQSLTSSESLKNNQNRQDYDEMKQSNKKMIISYDPNLNNDFMRVSQQNQDMTQSIRPKMETQTNPSKSQLASNLDIDSQIEISNDEEKSIFLFSKDNQIRILCLNIISHHVFDYFNVLSIVTLAILLVVDSPFVDPQSSEKKTINIINIILTTIFISENIIQIIAYGFIFSSSSFIQRNWIFNSIDFITTIASFFYSINVWKRSIYSFKFLLIFRISILLSFLSKQVKEVHFAGKILAKCLPRMIRLICFGMLFLLVSAVLVTKLLKGSLNSCFFGEEEYHKLEIQTKYDCYDLGGDWIDNLYNFNNIVNSLQVLYMVQSSEGWIHIMFGAYDSTSPEHHSEFKQKSLWVIFFIQFFFIANICILNMFVGLIVESHIEMIESEHHTEDLHKFQKEWLFIKESIYRLKPLPKIKIPNDRIRKFLFKHLIEGNILKVIFYCFTLANCINLMLFKNRQSQEEIDRLYIVNEVCLVAMVIEIFCRFLCQEIVFFKDPWNILDIITVIIGWTNLRLQQTHDFEIFNDSLRIFDGFAKGLQLIRFYRIMKHFVIIKKLFKSLQYAISSIFGIFLVLVVFLFLSVLICMNLFPYIKHQKFINGYDVTFGDFFNSLFTLIRIMTSEFWYVVASECARKMEPNFVCFDDIILYEDYQQYGQNACGSQVSYVFFYGFYLVFTLVILNIFIATIIESYKEAFSADESAVNHYQLDDVIELWKSYDPDGKGYISYKEFWQLSSQIAIIYGVKSEDLLDIQNKNEFLKTLDIPIFEDPDHKIFCYKFHDVVVSLSKVSVQIKYGITTLEPENINLRQKLNSQIKKSKLKGDDMIKPTSFTSSDMVVIIVLTRKVKQWKQRFLKKDNDFIFDIRQLTQKLRSQITKSQVIQEEDLSTCKKSDPNTDKKDTPEDEDEGQLVSYSPISIRNTNTNYEVKGKIKNIQNNLQEKNTEKNVKFFDHVVTRQTETENCETENFMIQRNDQAREQSDYNSLFSNNQGSKTFIQDSQNVLLERKSKSTNNQQQNLMETQLNKKNSSPSPTQNSQQMQNQTYKQQKQQKVETDKQYPQQQNQTYIEQQQNTQLSERNNKLEEQNNLLQKQIQQLKQQNNLLFEQNTLLKQQEQQQENKQQIIEQPKEKIENNNKQKPKQNDKEQKKRKKIKQKPLDLVTPVFEKANSFIKENENNNDDFGMEVNFNDNFILAFKDEENQDYFNQ